MAGAGRVYTPIDAQVVNSGIMTLSTSGEIPGGDEGAVGLMAWITWVYDDSGNGGYTNHGWFWNDSNNDLVRNWASYSTGTNDPDTNLPYASDESGYKKWLVDTQPQTLDLLLGGWDLSRKEAFVNSNMGILGVAPTDPSGCIEIHA